MSHGHSSSAHEHGHHGPDHLHTPELLIEEHKSEPPPTPGAYKLLALVALIMTILMAIITGVMWKQRDAALAELEFMKKGGGECSAPGDATAPDWLKNSGPAQTAPPASAKPPVVITGEEAPPAPTLPATANKPSTAQATPAPQPTQAANAHLPEYLVKSGDSMVKIGRSQQPKYCGLNPDKFNQEILTANQTASGDEFQVVKDIASIVAGQKIFLPAACQAAPAATTP